MLILVEGLVNVVGIEVLRGFVLLFIFRVGIWGEVGDVGDLLLEVLGLVDRFSGCVILFCNDY